MSNELALLNKQLVEDEGHSNPMTIEELGNRMKAWVTKSMLIPCRKYDSFSFCPGEMLYSLLLPTPIGGKHWASVYL
ncbi:MAG: hypothetical protein RLZZ385_2430 [Pseudomonadota bacterium]